jgi:oxygen-dependent protoporphyrinogen oxidase
MTDVAASGHAGMARPPRVVVIGAGIGGLACAHTIRELAGDALEVVVLEAASRPGGLIRSELHDGYRIEWATNGFLDNAPRTLALVQRLGLGPELEPSSATAAKRFILRGGRMHLLPVRPQDFMRSPLLSLRGRLRVALEPFARPAPAGIDETVHAFAARRIGDEAARILVDAMVSGVFAGDPRTISVASAFPLLVQLEAEHGGLIRGMLAKQRAARRDRRAGRPAAAVGAGPGGRLTSFRDGMETLPRRLAERLGTVVRYDTPVRAMRPATDDVARGAPRFRLELDGEREAVAADGVVVAVPAWTATRLVETLDAPLASELAAIHGAPLVVVALGFDAARLGSPPDGFGFLVPSGEGLAILGCLWDSSIFRFRAAPGRVLMRVMAGGARRPDLVELDDATLVDLVRRDLRRSMGLDVAPELLKVIRHRHGIAQYPPGHGARLARIDTRLAAHPGLELTGFSYRGIAVNRVIEDAEAVARRVVARLAAGAAG